MKEQKTMLQLVSRYQSSPLNTFERFCLGMMAVFFLFMLFLFLVRPLF